MHDSQRHDIVLVFSPHGNRATFSTLWSYFLTKFHREAREKGKDPLEKTQQNLVEKLPRNCRFLSLVVVKRSMNYIIKNKLHGMDHRILMMSCDILRALPSGPTDIIIRIIIIPPLSCYRVSLYPIALYVSGIAATIAEYRAITPNSRVSQTLLLMPESLVQAAQQRGHRGITRGAPQLKRSCRAGKRKTCTGTSPPLFLKRPCNGEKMAGTNEFASIG